MPAAKGSARTCSKLAVVCSYFTHWNLQISLKGILVLSFGLVAKCVGLYSRINFILLTITFVLMNPFTSIGANLFWFIIIVYVLTNQRKISIIVSLLVLDYLCDRKHLNNKSSNRALTEGKHVGVYKDPQPRRERRKKEREKVTAHASRSGQLLYWD